MLDFAMKSAAFPLAIAAVLAVAAPCISGAVPYISGAAPYISGAAPYISGAAPYISGAAPYISGAAPYISGAAPRTADRLVMHYDTLSAFGPRYENSQALESALSYISSVAQARTLRVISSTFDRDFSGHSFSRMLRIDVEGTGPGLLIVMVSAAMSDVTQPSVKTIGATAESGALGLAIALTAMEVLSDAHPAITVRFLFSGGEEGRSFDLLGSIGAPARLGAIFTANTLRSRPNLTVLHVDVPGPGATLGLSFGTTGLLAPYWLWDRWSNAFSDSGFPCIDIINRMLAFRLGFSDDPGPLAPWLNASIPAMAVVPVGTSGGPSTPAEYAGLVNGIERFVASSVEGFPDRWDRQYLAFSVAGLRLIVRETWYLAAVLGITAVLVVGYAISSMARRARLKSMLREAPRSVARLVGAFCALLAIVWAGGWLFELFESWYAPPDYWTTAPAWFFSIRVVSVGCAFALWAFACVRLGLMPRRPTFFETGAVAVFMIDVFLFSAVRLSLSVFFFWALGWAFLARLVARPWANFAAIPAALVPILVVVAELIANPARFFFASVLVPDMATSAVIAFMLLPFFLLLVGAVLSVAADTTRQMRYGMLVMMVALVAAVATEHFVASSKAQGRDVLARIVEHLDLATGAATVRVTSTWPLPDFFLERGDARLTMKKDFSGAAEVVSTHGAPRVGTGLSVIARGRLVLDRAIVSLTIDSDVPPYRLRVSLPDADARTVFDCSFPMVAKLGQSGIDIDIGPNPRLPLVVELVTSADFLANVTVQAIHLRHPAMFTVKGPVQVSDQMLVVTASTRAQISGKP